MIIDGKIIAHEILAGLKNRVSKLSFVPIFCDALVGSDPVARSFVETKGNAAKKIGMKFLLKEFSDSISQSELIEEIKNIGQVKELAGLVVQLPLPKNFDKQKILDAVPVELDVDCLGSFARKQFYNQTGNAVLPPTAGAVKEILSKVNGLKKDYRYLVIGQGDLVGKPVAQMLKQMSFYVDVADAGTDYLSYLAPNADVIILGVGRAGILTGENIKKGAIVIDAGSSESEGEILGDADFASVEKIAGAITPVPGGVGPVTVAFLMQNIVNSAEIKNENLNLTKRENWATI